MPLYPKSDRAHFMLLQPCQIKKLSYLKIELSVPYFTSKNPSKLHDCRSNKRACLVTAYWYAVLCPRIQKQIVNRNGGNLIFSFTENRIGVLSFPVLIFSIVNYDNDFLFKGILYTKVEFLPFQVSIEFQKCTIYVISFIRYVLVQDVSVTVFDSQPYFREVVVGCTICRV